MITSISLRKENQQCITDNTLCLLWSYVDQTCRFSNTLQQITKLGHKRDFSNYIESYMTNDK